MINQDCVVNKIAVRMTEISQPNGRLVDQPEHTGPNDKRQRKAIPRQRSSPSLKR
jgi:hypothetical protein